ncbi:MAG: M1 family metallopeptidase [Planctomycetota bacterium]
MPIRGLAVASLAAALFVAPAVPQAAAQSTPAPAEKFSQDDKFRQLDELLPTPNDYRTASGAPGHEYWQQRADYDIDVELNDETRIVNGSQTVTYYNQSPDTLRYLWVQLDRNNFTPNSHAQLTQTRDELEKMSFRTLRRHVARETFDGGMKIDRVETPTGDELDHTIVHTMMRVDLPEPLAPGARFAFKIAWRFEMNDTRVLNSRTSSEFFEEDGNYIHQVAHWFPRMAAYTDYAGWQHKQFLGRGEFTLEFGDYDVRITVPDDHIVSATGVLANPGDVLTSEQRRRLREAETASTPMFIVTPEEAKDNERTQPGGKATWRFQAENVRDFAFATSRKFIWDAMGYDLSDRGGELVMAMSFYPNEAEPLWSTYSTHAVVHTLDVVSDFAFVYPYPTAQSVNGPTGGMEYPMICFNGPRPEDDGTYTARSKYGLISVIIHEVIHFYFPMVVNSDERQWTWMDEGITTFLQYLTEQEWEDDYPSRRGEPKDITVYMSSPNQVPIMTNSESILQFGPNAYAKPATALNVLRETVLGRELFDHALREYARRWQFKRPEPADKFRTFEDASGVDLDWFWRGWYYTTDHVDVSVDNVRKFTIDSQNPDTEKAWRRTRRDAEPATLGERRNADLPKRTHAYPALLDFYNDYDELDVTPGDLREFQEYLDGLDDEDRALYEVDRNFYLIELGNRGGLVTPVILALHFEPGPSEELRIPAEIWRRDNERVSKLYSTERELVGVTFDPHLETADVEVENNHWPRRIVESRFELYKWKRDTPNPMREAKEELERDNVSSASDTGGED